MLSSWLHYFLESDALPLRHEVTASLLPMQHYVASWLCIKTIVMSNGPIYSLIKNITVHQEKFKIYGYGLAFGVFSMTF